MSTPVEAVTGNLQPERVNLSELDGQGSKALRDNESLSEIPNTVFESLSRSQFKTDPSQELQKELLWRTEENQFLSDVAKPSEMSEQTSFAAEKIAEIYELATTYTVAWNMAKKTGRDIETLLKAQ